MPMLFLASVVVSSVGVKHVGPKHVVVFRDFPKYNCVTIVIKHSFSTSFGPHNEDDVTQDVICWSSCKVSVIFIEALNIKFHENPSSERCCFLGLERRTNTTSLTATVPLKL
jgi:hypothetical protein